MSEKYFLAIDRGQTCIKTALCRMNAEVAHMESIQCEQLSVPAPGWAEQDMDDIWEKTAEAVRRLIKKAGVSAEDIIAVSFSGQGGGNFLIDEDGRPVRKGVLSMDNRHEAYAVEGIPRTILFMRWLKENEPDVFKKTRFILGSKDWIRFRLTGKANADMSDTPAPVCNGVYITGLCKKAGVPEAEKMLPPLVYANEICGAITKEAADICGLAEGTPVVAGAHDMIACSLGTGGVKQGHLTVIMGTLGINIAVVGDGVGNLKPERPGEIFEFAGTGKGTRTATSSIGACGRAFDSFINLFFSDIKNAAVKARKDIFEYIEDMLSTTKEPVSEKFFPYIMGTFYDSSLKAGFGGITADTDKTDLLMAMYQGICFSMCMEIEKLGEKLGAFDDIWMVGGGSKSRIWPQMFADVLNARVKIGKTSEMGCRGAAICAAEALGISKTEMYEPEVKETFVPNCEKHRKYERLFEEYKNNLL